MPGEPHAKPGGGQSALELVQKRCWAWRYELLDAGRPVATIRVAHWRECGELVVGGTPLAAPPLEVRPLDWLGHRFVVGAPDHPVARAERERLLRFDYRVEHQGRSWTVRCRGPFHRGLTILSGTSVDRVVGEIRPVGWFHRRATVALPPEMPPLVQAFVCWLAVLRWKRRATRS